MAQYDIEIKDLLRIIRRRKNVIVFSTITLGILSFFFAFLQTPAPLYEATAKIKYDKNQVFTTVFDTPFYWSPYDNVISQTKIITGSSVLKLAAEKLKQKYEEFSDIETATLIGMLESMVRTEQEENTNIIRIIVTYSDPTMAAEIANIVASSYQEYKKTEMKGKTEETRAFIEDQLEKVSTKLREAEEKYKKFQEERNIVFIDTQANNDIQVLASLESDYDSLNRENASLNFLKKYAKEKNLDKLQSFNPQFLNIDTPLNKINNTLQDLLSEREQLLSIYTVNHPKIIELDGKINQMLEMVSGEIDTRLKTNYARMEILNKDIDRFEKKADEYPNDFLTLARYKREVELQTQLYSELNLKYQEVLIQETEKIEEIAIVSEALVPTQPTNSPRTIPSLIIGIIMGALLGIFFAVVLENLDTSIGTIEDVESYLGLPVLGVIPYHTFEEEKGKTEVEKPMPIVLLMNPKSQMVEAYRSLRTNILFLNKEKDISLLMITSSSLQEGKTINSINTAITLAQGGYKTLLVEADLRRATIGKFFGVDKSPGLSDVILGVKKWQEVIKDINDIMLGGMNVDVLIKSPDLSNLHIITSGAFPTNPAELINSKQMSKFIDEVKHVYDFVIFDSPPVLPVTDAVLLSQKVDGVILLYEVGKIARGVLRRSKSHLDNVKATVLGVIINGVRPEYGPEYYEYHYQYYYGEGDKHRKITESEKIDRLLSMETLKNIFLTGKKFVLATISGIKKRLKKNIDKDKNSSKGSREK